MADAADATETNWMMRYWIGVGMVMAGLPVPSLLAALGLPRHFAAAVGVAVGIFGAGVVIRVLFGLRSSFNAEMRRRDAATRRDDEEHRAFLESVRDLPPEEKDRLIAERLHVLIGAISPSEQ